ncbi:MAG: Rpn family recombination-promoting nuclease/putative transposase, partial [Emergencia sp.]
MQEKKFYPFTDPVVFPLVMYDADMCRQLIERILPGRRVRQIRFSGQDENGRVDVEKAILNSPFHKGIRLDVLFDGDDQWYDLEMQLERNRNIPKRSRYYHGLIDSHILEKGQNYSRLKPSYVIFLCQFDLFGLDEAVYCFQYYDEKKGLPLGDESYTLILNSKCSEEKVPPALQMLFAYMNSGKLPGDADAFIRCIHSRVTELNQGKELSTVMTLEEQLRLEAEWAREDGIEEGR